MLAYAWQGLSKEIAFNVALMYHILQVIPVTLIGAYYYFTTFRHERPTPASISPTATKD